MADFQTVTEYLTGKTGHVHDGVLYHPDWAGGCLGCRDEPMFKDGDRVSVTFTGAVDDDPDDDSVGIIVDGIPDGWRAVVPSGVVRRG